MVRFTIKRGGRIYALFFMHGPQGLVICQERERGEGGPTQDEAQCILNALHKCEEMRGEFIPLSKGWQDEEGKWEEVEEKGEDLLREVENEERHHFSIERRWWFKI